MASLKKRNSYGWTALVSQGFLVVQVSRTHSIRHTTFGRTPLDEWSACRRNLYLTTHNITREKHPCPRGDLNPQSHQASGSRPTP